MAFLYLSSSASESSFNETETLLVQVCKAIDAYLFSCQDSRVNHLSANFNWFKRSSESLSCWCYIDDAMWTSLFSLNWFILRQLSLMFFTRNFHLSKSSYSLILFKVWPEICSLYISSIRMSIQTSKSFRHDLRLWPASFNHCSQLLNTLRT